ncbi:hypothetical protein [Tropicimonas sp. IMCC34043]|uniref:hypothetical protein n=1 Tax=Tropicimonas sp. IMCC34043 TaxID=2248760 RepID=UPI000E269D51|nr:hypothetical protein [Tropicimonas sp. IMCC34043]
MERMQRDLARYTHPVIRAIGPCGVAYLASWAMVMALGAEAGAMVVVAAMSATVLVLGAPAFALAVAAERHFRGRLERIAGESGRTNRFVQPNQVPGQVPCNAVQ